LSTDPKRRARRATARARWRSWVACCALLAMTSASLGPLPWIVTGIAPVAAQGVEHDHDGGALRSHHHHSDASDVPGSPTHPPDHDCAPCQLLKHLARWAVLPSAPPAVVLQTPPSVLPQPVAEPQRATPVAALPPVRGPPSRIA